MSGNNVSHSNRHTKTRFVANVHKQTLVREGQTVKVKICTRCLRSLLSQNYPREEFDNLKFENLTPPPGQEVSLEASGGLPGHPQCFYILLKMYFQPCR